MAEVEQPVAAGDAAGAAGSPADEQGYLLRGVVRSRGHERALAKLAVAAEDDLIEHQGLAALVHVVPYRLPAWDKEHIREHSAMVERAMRRATIVPAPYGVVFKDQDQVVAFLEDQQVALDEALSFLDGAFEIRLHILPSGRRPDITEGELHERAAGFYTSLRRRSRAAYTLPPTGTRILSGVFLVGRADWVNFVEYADELDAAHPEFQFDITGPWPPYDFVRMALFPEERAGA